MPLTQVAAVQPKGVNRELVDAALDHIRNTLTLGFARSALEVGQYLLDTFFDGDPSQFRNPRCESPSFRALCETKGLSSMGVSRSTLYNCVQIHIQFTQSGIQELKDLSYSHQVTLLRAPQEVKEHLAKKAVDESIGVRQLMAQVTRSRPPSKRGRPRKPEVVRAVDRIRTCLSKVDRENIDELNLNPRVNLQELLDSVDDVCKQLEHLRDDIENSVVLGVGSRSQSPFDTLPSTRHELVKDVGST